MQQLSLLERIYFLKLVLNIWLIADFVQCLRLMPVITYIRVVVGIRHVVGFACFFCISEDDVKNDLEKTYIRREIFSSQYFGKKD